MDQSDRHDAVCIRSVDPFCRLCSLLNILRDSGQLPHPEPVLLFYIHLKQSIHRKLFPGAGRKSLQKWVKK